MISKHSPIQMPSLGVNIDHIATLRQLRRTPYPNLIEAARLAIQGGAAQITVHLREDRRHIQDEDVHHLIQLKKSLNFSLNLEMSISPQMVKFALKALPDWVCLVPEKRQELTTEGGLDVIKYEKKLKKVIAQLKQVGIKVSCFIEPQAQMVKVSQKIGADAVELHTGKYCLAVQKGNSRQVEVQFQKIKKAAWVAIDQNIHCHAGHGFDFHNVRKIAELTQADGTPLIKEYNIGHAIVCRAALVGLEQSVREMVSAILAP